MCQQEQKPPCGKDTITPNTQSLQSQSVSWAAFAGVIWLDGTHSTVHTRSYPGEVAGCSMAELYVRLAASADASNRCLPADYRAVAQWSIHACPGAQRQCAWCRGNPPDKDGFLFTTGPLFLWLCSVSPVKHCSQPRLCFLFCLKPLMTRCLPAGLGI